ncbi:MAG: glycosyltransferase [Lutibacter sp.]|nr:glycosyltransferase [Lutibacter sp.]
MKISVVTINLNNSDGLRRSLSSFFSQKDHTSEIIVIDGMSNDTSALVIREYKTRVSKFVIEKDTGIFNAMNKGIKLAAGDYIYFLNSGEVFFSDNTLSIVENALYDDSKIYYFNVDFYFGEKLLGHANNDLSWFVHQSCLVPAKLMRRYLFDDKYKIFGDLDLWTRLKRDGAFNLQYVEETICIMKLDGIGSSPFYPKRKIFEKYLYARKHKKYMKSTVSAINILISYLIVLFFGEEFLFFKYYPFVNKVKNAF